MLDYSNVKLVEWKFTSYTFMKMNLTFCEINSIKIYSTSKWYQILWDTLYYYFVCMYIIQYFRQNKYQKSACTPLCPVILDNHVLERPSAIFVIDRLGKALLKLEPIFITRGCWLSLARMAEGRLLLGESVLGVVSSSHSRGGGGAPI